MRNIAKSIFSAFLLTLLVGLVFPKVKALSSEPWIKSLDSPVLNVGAINEWDDSTVFQPTILYDGIGYKMWYSGFDGSRFQIGYATSSDGINWTRYASNPVLSKLNLGRDAHNPMVINDNGTFKMWYSTSVGGGTSDFRIHHATSTDGINWTDAIGAPVLIPTEGWEVGGVSDPYVIKQASEYRMWYDGFGGGTWKTGYATSLDGISWTKLPTNPVTPNATGGVTYDGSIYTRYYHTDSPSVLKKATSPDGINWTDSSDNPLITTGANGAFDDFRVAGPQVIQVGNTLKMYYGGHDGSTGWRIGLAEMELPVPTPSPSPTPVPVPYFNQGDLPWGPQEYNFASSWADGEAITMKRWGCAVTSAAMVFSRYGIAASDGSALSPSTLNDWLKSQPDGYIPNGRTNWLALTRYSREQNEAYGSPILKFRRSGADDFDTLDTDLALSQPDIVQQPGHFVVVTDKIPATSIYRINDPSYRDRPTLDSYGNSFQTLNRFIPTSTNLSAIYLVIDQSVNALITDSLGRKSGVDGNGQVYNEIPEAQYFLDEPIHDDLNPENIAGPAVDIFYLPEPSDGEYSVQVFSDTPTPFRLNSYLYDRDANPLLNEFEGATSSQNSPEFKLSFTGNEPSQIKSVVTFASLRKNIRTSYRLGWITKRGVYRGLTNIAKAAQRLDKRGLTTPNKGLLNTLLRLLDTFHPKFLSNEGYNLLSSNVQVLLDTL